MIFPKETIVTSVPSLLISATPIGMVYSPSGTALKLKTPYYLATKALARSKDIFKLKKQFIDEEYYPLISYLQSIEAFNDFSEEQKLHLIRNYFYGN